MSDEPSGLLAIWQEIGMNIQVLGVAGLAGAFIKAIVAPEKQWKRRAVQAIVGLFSAIFLGGFLGSLIEDFVTISAYAYLASGFVCGTAGEGAIAYAQSKLLTDNKPGSSGSSRGGERDEEVYYPDYEGEDPRRLPPRRGSRRGRRPPPGR